MPEVSFRICGLVFYIFNERGGKHHLPHVLITYGSESANFVIETGEQLDGDLKFAQVKKVKTILSCQSNVKELLDRWHFLNQENVPGKVEKIRLKI